MASGTDTFVHAVKYAQRIREIIEPHIGPQRLSMAEIWELRFYSHQASAEDKATFLG